MSHEFSYVITDELMRRAPRRLFYGRLAPRFAVIVLLLGVLFAFAPSQGEGRYLAGFLTGVLVVFALLLILSAVSLEQRMERYLRKLGDRNARCVISEEGITVENAAARSFVKWNVIERLVRDREAWLLFISRQQYFVLPVAALAGDPGTFIERRIAAAGGRLR